MTLGEFVRRRRAMLGLTQAEVMEQIPGRSTNWLSRIENDQQRELPEPELLRLLAMALGTDVLDLLEAHGYLSLVPPEADDQVYVIDLDQLDVPWLEGEQELTMAQKIAIREVIRVLMRRQNESKNTEAPGNVRQLPEQKKE